MIFNFPQLIAHAAKTRALAAGTIVGSGTVSNTRPAMPAPAASPSGACWRQIESGAPTTPFLKFGDRVRIEMRDAGGHSIFGAIDQHVRRV